MENFSLIAKIQSLGPEDLMFVNFKNKLRTMLGLPHNQKVDQVHFRQKLFVKNAKGIIILSNKKKTVNEERQKDIDRVIEEIKEKMAVNLLEIAKFKAASTIDKEEEIIDHESYSDLMKGKSFDSLEAVLIASVQETVYKELMEKILIDNSEFFTNFVSAVLKIAGSEEVVPLLQSVAESHGYKLTKITDKVEAE